MCPRFLFQEFHGLTERIAHEHCGFVSTGFGTLAYDLPGIELPQLGNEVLVVLHVAAVPGAPCAVSVIQLGGLCLGPGIGHEAVLRKLSDLVAVMVVGGVGGVNDRLRRRKTFGLFGSHSLLKDGGIGEVAARSGHTGYRLSGFPHIFLKHLGQSVRPLLDAGAADGVAGDGDKTARVPGHIDLQFDPAVIDVIAVLVVSRERGFEQNPHACPGRAVFRIGIHPGDDVFGHIRQHAVLDTAVDVDGADVAEDADADSVISGPVPDGYGVIREGGLIRRISTEAVRLIRLLGPAPVSLLIFPEAESTSFF